MYYTLSYGEEMKMSYFMANLIEIYNYNGSHLEFRKNFIKL